MNKPKSRVALSLVLLAVFVSPLTRAENGNSIPATPEYGVERDLIPLITQDQVLAMFGVRLDPSAELPLIAEVVSGWGDHLFGFDQFKYCIKGVYEKGPSWFSSWPSPKQENRIRNHIYVLAQKVGTPSHKVVVFDVTASAYDYPSLLQGEMTWNLYSLKYDTFKKALKNTPNCE